MGTSLERGANSVACRHCCTLYQVPLTYLDAAKRPTNAPTPLYPDALITAF
jgi:hypothetical protein